MATFAQLEARVRSEIIAEKYDDQYVSADIQDDLWNSSVEIAAMMGFPVILDTASVSVTAGDTVITPPADMQRPLRIIINGDNGEFAQIDRVLSERAAGQGPFRVWNWDTKSAGDIYIGPAINHTGAIVIEYVQTLTKPGTLSSATPWNTGAVTLMPEWHWLIAYHAASRFFQEAEREDEASYWMQMYQAGLTNFAIFLGRGDIADLMLGGIQAGANAQAGKPQQPQGTQSAQQQLGYGGMLGQ